MKKSKMSGIQKKYLKYMCTLLILALVLSSICVWTYVRRNMTDVIVDKYEFMNEKMGIALDNLYRKTDAVTAEIILENDVQKSLKNKELQEVEKNTLIPRLVIRIFKAVVCVKKWGMSMRRRSGSGPGITCLVRGTKLCLSEDM